MADKAQDRRSRRAERRREEILSAAASVFAARGFSNATTKAIAEQADIAEGTIYNYFSSKEDLVAALAERVQAEISALIPPASATQDDRALVRSAVEGLLELIAERRTEIRGLVTALWDRGPLFQGFLVPGAGEWIARVSEFLQRRAAEGKIRECDASVVARMVMGMVIYVVMPYLQGIEPLPSTDEQRRHADLLVTVLFDGLARREGEP